MDYSEFQKTKLGQEITNLVNLIINEKSIIPKNPIFITALGLTNSEFIEEFETKKKEVN